MIRGDRPLAAGPLRAGSPPQGAAGQLRSVVRTYALTASRAAGESHIRRTRSSVTRCAEMRSSAGPRIWLRVCRSGSAGSAASSSAIAPARR
jgi:hypothetical protein